MKTHTCFLSVSPFLPFLFSLSTLSFLITAYLCLASFCTLHPTGKEEFRQNPKLSLFLFNVSSKNKITKSVLWLPVALAITGKDSEWVCLEYTCLWTSRHVSPACWMWAHFSLTISVCSMWCFFLRIYLNQCPFCGFQFRLN